MRILQYLSMTLTQVPWGHIEFLFVSVEEWQRECLSKGRDTVHSIQWLVLSQPETYFSNIPRMHFLTVLEPETSCSGGNRSGSDSSRLQGKITCLFQLLWLLAWLAYTLLQTISTVSVFCAVWVFFSQNVSEDNICHWIRVCPHNCGWSHFNSSKVILVLGH